jgi:hypothetical protein
MVAKFNGKPPVKTTGAANPTGKPAPIKPKVIQSTYQKAKKAGGSANAGTGIGNS